MFQVSAVFHYTTVLHIMYFIANYNAKRNMNCAVNYTSFLKSIGIYNTHNWLEHLHEQFLLLGTVNTPHESNIILGPYNWSLHTLSFLSCLAYGKHGITAVTRDAEAILQALIMIRSSIKLSLTSPLPLCTIYTSSPRTDSPISTLWEKYHSTTWEEDYF